ncbi:E3 ubiquitin-protein ligase NRDP1-like [Sycon ciliatum]|uniref:E3 ubiquitin-protein ligase NRDP1-like n=1 Tax=Sycon ciliatum TaxID=27933 RepID=UPI0031F63A11
MAEVPEQAAALALVAQAVALAEELAEALTEEASATIAAAKGPSGLEYTAMVTWPSNNIGGFDEEAFITRPATELFCPVCGGVLRHPILAVRCGHHFCHSCITEVLKRNQPCPLDRGALSWVVPGDLVEDRSVKRRIGELKITCEKKVNGCTWTGPLSSYDAHVTRDHS